MQNISKFGLSKRGFLPSETPIKVIDSKSSAALNIHELANELPKLMLTNKLRTQINKFKPNDLDIDIQDFTNEELSLLFSQLSFLSHAYVLGDKLPSSTLPESLAKPWVKIAEKFGRPPVLSYASYCLSNWFKIDENQNIGLDNVALINNFLGGIDEDWFVTIHVCIEDAAGPALNSVLNIVQNNLFNDEKALISELGTIHNSLLEVNRIFRLMPEKCDPYIYYHRVRPYIFGWKNNPDLPDGLIYKGQFDNKPQFFRGETGAQSSIVPTLDALFSVVHEKDELREYLDEMKLYMPVKHQALIKYIEENSKFNKYEFSSNINLLRDQCLEQMSIFRSQHLQYAADYIHKQSVKTTLFGSGGSVIRGTGGTPFMKYLKKHRDETDLSKKN
tara:strand:+ start:2686 stop:3852 length:1167 start_codon:yes stop_codon:yes gene_type:complete